MRQVKQIMGMPIAVEIRGSDANNSDFKPVFDKFSELEHQLSPFISDSELSLYQKGVLKKQAPSGSFLRVKKACEKYQNLTGGYFSANFGGNYNPTGLVKAWAIKQAAKQLDKLGKNSYMINAGGDILAISSGNKDEWSIGLQNPFDKYKTYGKLVVNNLAVATSGNYARGKHIIDPHNKLPASSLAAVTIFGNDIVRADVFATTVFAMGLKKGLSFINKQKGYNAVIVSNDKKLHCSDGLKSEFSFKL